MSVLYLCDQQSPHRGSLTEAPATGEGWDSREVEGLVAVETLKGAGHLSLSGAGRWQLWGRKARAQHPAHRSRDPHFCARLIPFHSTSPVHSAAVASGPGRGRLGPLSA